MIFRDENNEISNKKKTKSNIQGDFGRNESLSGSTSVYEKYIYISEWQQ